MGSGCDINKIQISVLVQQSSGLRNTNSLNDFVVAKIFGRHIKLTWIFSKRK